MKYSRTYLVGLLKEHKLKGYSHYNTKPELIELLISKGILSEEKVTSFQTPPADAPEIIGQSELDPRNRNPQKIRRPPKHVKITNLETDEVMEFPSLYKCGKALKINTGSLKYHNNKQIGNYLIEISQ